MADTVAFQTLSAQVETAGLPAPLILAQPVNIKDTFHLENGQILRRQALDKHAS
jgi:hypothetical protein